MIKRIFLSESGVAEDTDSTDKVGLGSSNTLKLEDKQSGISYEIEYVKSYDLEVGAMYLSQKYITFVLGKDKINLFKNAISVINSFKFPDDVMKKEFSKALPQIKSSFETDDLCVLMLEKDPELVLLDDVNEYYNKELHPRHIAWIISTLYNLDC